LTAGPNVGGYVIQARLGAGGVGIVYGGVHTGTGQRAAIKVLHEMYGGDPGMVQRFEQEAMLVNGVHHPNIVEVYAFGEVADGRKYIAMEWLQGESLSDRIDRGRIPPRELVAILEGVCDALQLVHAKGVIHRDIKSDNVFLNASSGLMQPKLLDFGFAKLAGMNPRQMTKTKTGMVVGTPAYLSPEQARGKLADERSDIYALGILAHKMLTGRLPFEGSTPIDFIMGHLRTPPPDPRKLAPDIPEPLALMVVRMMAKTPEERPGLGEIRGVLAQVRPPPLAPAAMTTPPLSATSPRAGTPWRRLVIAFGLIVVSAAIAFAVVNSVG
jgi:serine/threonine-protein kinase